MVHISEKISKPRIQKYFDIAGRPGAIPALDGLRAIAILLVVARHYIKTANESFSLTSNIILLKPFINIAENGWLGVDLFFVLSGFLIFDSLSKKKIKFSSLSKFYLKRILRTFPIYYAFIIVIYFNLIPLYSPHETPITSKELFKHVIFMQDYNGTSILVTMWSLAVEEKFYLVSPFILYFLSLIKQKSMLIKTLILFTLIPLLTKLIGINLFQPYDYIQYFWTIRSPFHQAIDSIFIGVICSYVYKEKRIIDFVTKNHRYILRCAWLLIFLFLASENLIASEKWQLVTISSFTITLLFGVLVCTYSCTNNKIHNKLSGYRMRFISKISYSLYLAHFTVIPLSLYLTIEVLNMQMLWQHMTIFLIFYLILSFVLTMIMHLLIEKPFLALKSKIH